MIRSHECKESGYEYTHDNKVLTIFSCSNYYDYGSNNGAYAKISSKIKPIIVQFFVKQGDEVTKNLTIRERVNVNELSAINQLLEKFVANKLKLNEAFKEKDPGNTGLVNLNDWCTVVGDVLDMKLPWRILRPKLAKENSDGMILYQSTFEGYHISHLSNPTVKK
jgi:serine/threonine-protein phosphatase with EF-hand domain